MIPQNTVNDLIYLLSIAVKDFEATRLLYSKGYKEDQFIYAKHFLKPSEEDILVWNMTFGNHLAKIIFLVSLLKNIFCTTTD